MRVLEIGGAPFLSRFLPSSSDFYKTGRSDANAALLGFSQLLELRRRLRAGVYDLVVYHITSKVVAPWHRPGRAWRAGFDVLARSLLRPQQITWHYLHYFLCGTSVPLIVVDGQDVPRVTKSELAWLERCRFWFMRELPSNHLNLFLNMDASSGDVVNIQRNPRVKRNLEKIERFGLGFYPEKLPQIEPLEAEEKIYDVFYAGKNHTTTLRPRGVEELIALCKSGVRVFIPEERLPREEFLRACAQSWLVWSPEGQGWDCYRHYEALFMHSVPLINYPTIEHWQPLLHGRHCLYHRPEPGGLSEAVREALREPELLRKIAAEGCAHALHHHTQAALARHVLEKADLFAPLASTWVE